jgi:hypothetical protein
LSASYLEAATSSLIIRFAVLEDDFGDDCVIGLLTGEPRSAALVVAR